MHGCSRGGCMVAPGGGGGGACVVVLGGCMVDLGGGGMHGCSRGGMHGCSWGVCGCSGRACVVALGGVHGCSGGACVVFRGACVVFGGGVHGFFDEIRSMSGRYASYWNAFLFTQENILVRCVLLARPLYVPQKPATRYQHHGEGALYHELLK